MPEFVVIEDAVQPSTCAKLIEAYAESGFQPAQIGGGARVRDVRDVRLARVPLDRGIGATMAGIALAVNREHWKFDVTHANQCDLLRYDKEGHYDAHLDIFLNRDQECRKLSVLLFLSDDHEGGKFYLQVGSKPSYPIQKPGTVVVFPSFLLHGVEPVTSGVRFSLITWMVGPWLQ